MKKRFWATFVLASILTLSACGPTSRNLSNSGSNGGNPGGNGYNGSSSGQNKRPAVTAPYQPSLYDPGSACASVTGDYEDMTQLSADCFRVWAPFDIGAIPGPGLLQQNPPWYPNTVQALPPVTPSQAAQWAQAYVRDQILVRFAEQTGDYSLLTTVGAAPADDVEAQLVKAGASLEFPSCYRTTTLRAVDLDNQALGYIGPLSNGATPSTAMIATFPGCPSGVGIVAHFKGSTATKLIPLDQKESNIVVTGTIETIAPFGKLWIINTEVPCGDQALSSICP